MRLTEGEPLKECGKQDVVAYWTAHGMPFRAPRAGKTTPDSFLAVLLLSLLVPTAHFYNRGVPQPGWVLQTLVVFNIPTIF